VAHRVVEVAIVNAIVNERPAAGKVGKDEHRDRRLGELEKAAACTAMNK
jgi:hypothetical protein